MGAMAYKRFIRYSLIGSICWVLFFTLSGFFFGNIAYVKNNFILVLAVIALFSTFSVIIVYLKNRKYKMKKAIKK